ncbi:MAG: ABC transporter substrate-binding protein, partial [Clostridiales Family XIII bacterium]|nr:ABC transporter substrate-binding protein [Clostridiales Family XIII bacterium]
MDGQRGRSEGRGGRTTRTKRRTLWTDEAKDDPKPEKWRTAMMCKRETMTNKRWACLLALALALVTVLAGCGGTSDPASEGGGGDSPSAAAQKDGINVYVGGTIFSSSLNPVKGAMSYGYPFTNIALLRVDPASAYVGDAASAWDISADALTYTFTVRDGLKFSDGSDLTAEDVVFTYETVQANQAENGNVDLTKLASVKADGADKVVFTLSEPYSPFLDTTAMLGIVPSDAYDADAFDRTPIGAGPWKVVQYDPEQQIIVAPNEHYYEGVPSIQKVTFVNMEEDAAIAAA